MLMMLIMIVIMVNIMVVNMMAYRFHCWLQQILVVADELRGFREASPIVVCSSVKCWANTISEAEMRIICL